MGKPGPRKLYKYPDQFKAQAVSLSELPGVAVQDVAQSLAIHPFMLSRWRKQVRDGEIVAKGKGLDAGVAAELKELRKLKRAHERLKMEHAILKKWVAWKAEQKQNASSSSTPTDKPSRSACCADSME